MIRVPRKVVTQWSRAAGGWPHVSAWLRQRANKAAESRRKVADTPTGKILVMVRSTAKEVARWSKVTDGLPLSTWLRGVGGRAPR